MISSHRLNLLNRRRFLSLSAAAAGAVIATPIYAQHSTSARITGSLKVDESVDLHSVPSNFNGLSYESAQLANPEFFSASNRGLIRLFRQLAPNGVLRIGGGTSDYTTYSPHVPPGPPPFTVFGPDTSHKAKEGTITSELALHNLRAFLNATNWTCLYGLNLGTGTKANAVAEAEAAHRILGPRLLALQLGNEPDTFRHFRNGHYSPQEYVHDWIAFRDAIVKRVAQAHFAGPDISNNLAYLTAFAEIAPEYRDIVLLTMHYYAMGPAGNPRTTLNNLLSPNPQLTTMKWSKLPTVFDAMHTAHLPCRISEVNSCWNGGEPGVSNVFASALWCCDMMLHFAALGFAGVNLHGGGYGVYSPIVGSPESGFTRRPEYYGMLFAQHFAGATMLQSSFNCSDNRVTAYTARSEQGGKSNLRLAFINKTNSPAQIQLAGLSGGQVRWSCTELSAPSLTAASGVSLKRIAGQHGLSISLASHSALLLCRE